MEASNRFDFLPTSLTLAGGVNILPDLRGEIETEFDYEDWRGREAEITFIEIIGNAAFTMKFNRDTICASDELPDGTHRIVYGGESVEERTGLVVISQATPGDDVSGVSVSLVRLGWFIDVKSHNVVEFDPVSGATVTVTDDYGREIPPCDDTDPKYELGVRRWYVVSVTASNYDDYEERFIYRGDDEIVIDSVPEAFDITFAIAPSTAPATIVVKDDDGEVVAPTDNPLVYHLPNSTVVGDYTYTAKVVGHIDTTGTITVTADATINIAPDSWLKSIAVTTAPAKTIYNEDELFDPTDMVITATYYDNTTDVVNDYTYSPDGALDAGVTAITISYTEGGVTKTATQAITVIAWLQSVAITTPPTKTAYTEGETYDPDGMVVTATYSDASTAAVTGYTYEPDGALAVSDTEIEVSYKEGGATETATQAITVSAP